MHLSKWYLRKINEMNQKKWVLFPQKWELFSKILQKGL